MLRTRKAGLEVLPWELSTALLRFASGRAHHLAFEEINVAPKEAQEAVPTGKAHTVYVLHGLLGSGRNWRTNFTNPCTASPAVVRRVHPLLLCLPCAACAARD
eukprot:jgi/Botrbrau1/3216/Bobra.37_2s0045.1